MKPITVAVLIAVGAMAGAGGVVAWETLSLDPPPFAHTLSDRQDLSRSSLSTHALARELLGRVGQTFIEDTRGPGRIYAGVSFVTQPKPYGEILCRVDFVHVPQKIVHGPQDRNDFWTDDLTITRMFGIWREPGATGNGLTRETACSRFRDFSHLILSEDDDLGGDVERTVNVLSKARVLAKAGRANFVVTCVDDREPYRPAKCDGIDLLRRLDLKDIHQVRSVETKTAKESEQHKDQALTKFTPRSGCGGGSEYVQLDISSLQVFGRDSRDDGDPKQIDIELGAIC
jgi:hypothetical protein